MRLPPRRSARLGPEFDTSLLAWARGARRTYLAVVCLTLIGSLAAPARAAAPPFTIELARAWSGPAKASEPRWSAEANGPHVARWPGGCELRILASPDATVHDEHVRQIAFRRIWTSDLPCATSAAHLTMLLRERYLESTNERQAQIAGVEQVLIALAALLLSLLPFAAFEALRRLDRKTLWIAAGAMLFAFIVRAVAPHRLVMVYFGYEHVGEAVDLANLPRYGPGATVLWWALFRFFAPDHATVLWLHAVLGSLTVGLWVAYVHRVTDRPLGALVTGLTLSVAPVFVRDHVSESMAVPAMFAFGLAALLVNELVRATDALRVSPPAPAESITLTRAQPRAGTLRIGIALVVAVTYAAMCRPDLAMAALPFLLAFALAANPFLGVARTLRRSWPYVVTAAILGAPLVVAAALHAAHDAELGNLPRMGATFFADLPRLVWHESAVLQLAAFPLGVWALLAAALPFAAQGRRALWLCAGALASIVPTFVDYNEVSTLRLHAPAASLVVVACGLGFAALQSRGRWGTTAAAFLMACALPTFWPSIEPLFRARNPDQEESLIREVLSTVRKEEPHGASLARLGYGDLTVRNVHLHFPDYLFHPHRIRPRNVSEVVQSTVRSPTYFFLSMRCYLWPAWNPDAPKGSLHAACREICEAKRCTPVFERDVPNLGDWPHFDGYGTAATLRVGLYRLRERAESEMKSVP